MSRGPNAQYNVAKADSLSVRVAARVRRRMFDRFMAEFTPGPESTVLDVGVTSENTYESSNYFEELYPWKERIVAAGLDDARYLQDRYVGIRFVGANALALPFRDQTFDLVHSSAVIEHVGSAENQARFIAECARVARIGFCFTTPNRWFPIEFHTQLPLVHWLPKPQYRSVFRMLGLDFFADEQNLNLLSPGQCGRMAAEIPGFASRVYLERLLGWPSNIVLFGVRHEWTDSNL